MAFGGYAAGWCFIHSHPLTERARPHREDLYPRRDRIPHRKRHLRPHRCACPAPVGGADTALAAPLRHLGRAHGAGA